MLDQIKYEYITLNMPNIQVAWERGKDRSGMSFEIDSRIKDLITQAAIKFPMWRFMSGGDQGGLSSVLDNLTRQVTAYQCYRVWVLEGTEVLGILTYEYRKKSGKVAYSLTNERIQNKRERGSSDVTKDINKALKIMAKSFGSKTITERIEDAQSACDHNVRSICSNKASDFFGDYRTVTNAVRHYLMSEKWEAVKQAALDNEADLTVLDRLPNVYEEYVVAEEIERCVKERNGVVVIIHGNDYAVQSFPIANAHPIVEMFSTETLPEWIKRGVGMLKLVEPRQMIGKIGYKIYDGAFFVMKGEQ